MEILIGTQKKIYAEYFGVKISPTFIEEEITENMVKSGIALVPAGVYKEPCLSFEGEEEALDDLWDELRALRADRRLGDEKKGDEATIASLLELSQLFAASAKKKAAIGEVLYPSR